MEIGVLGAGGVGVTLAKGWLRKGHSICFGSRDPRSEKMHAAIKETGVGARSASLAEAASQAEVVVLTTPWAGTEEAVRAAGDLNGKPLLDVTNPLGPDLQLAIQPGTSAAELVSQWSPGARVVKIFNTVGSSIMANPQLSSGPATMLYCGDDAEAKRIAHALAEDLGFEPLDAGPLRQARLLESFAALWISLAFGAGLGREFAFRLETR
ncbi:MAG TPA: NAD(P)-binding domain-containing protein [Bryobacteraceae bacterium]|nr:NAD(P)-binding domain-containing protein [Bryobacteraceae bacterium]